MCISLAEWHAGYGLGCLDHRWWWDRGRVPFVPEVARQLLENTIAVGVGYAAVGVQDAPVAGSQSAVYCREELGCRGIGSGGIPGQSLVLFLTPGLLSQLLSVCA